MFKDKWHGSPRFRLLTALLLNMAVYICIVAMILPLYQANDDFEMMSFVDGQMTQKDKYIPFLNYIFSCFLKLVYTVFSDTLPWYPIIQHALMLSGFTALSWVFYERLRFWQGSTVNIIMLVLIGASCYTDMNFTKVCVHCQRLCHYAAGHGGLPCRQKKASFDVGCCT